MKLESKLKVYEKNIQFKRGNKFLYIDTHTYFRKKIQNVHRNIILGIVMNTLEAKKGELESILDKHKQFIS